jgi:methionine sulfoxide reductase heme-binding subunit
MTPIRNTTGINMSDQALQSPPLPQPAGRRVPWWLFTAVLAVTAAIILGSGTIWGWGEDGLQHITRYTARVAFLMFVTVFAAGALCRFVPADATRWLKRNRRYLGLSFALAHFLHLGALTSLFIAIGAVPAAQTLIFGGLAYVLIALMAVTSNDWSVRALGPRLWRGLHLVGLYYVWLIFMNSYIGRAVSDSPPEPRIIFAITTGLGLAALGLRIAAWLARRRSTVVG